MQSLKMRDKVIVYLGFFILSASASPLGSRYRGTNIHHGTPLVCVNTGVATHLHIVNSGGSTSHLQSQVVDMIVVTR